MARFGTFRFATSRFAAVLATGISTPGSRFGSFRFGTARFGKGAVVGAADNTLAGISIGSAADSLDLVGFFPIAGESTGSAPNELDITGVITLDLISTGTGPSVLLLSEIDDFDGLDSTGFAPDSLSLSNIIAIDGTSLGLGLSTLFANAIKPLDGVIVGSGPSILGLSEIRPVDFNASLGSAPSELLLQLARILAEDFVFYWDSTRTLIATVGDKPLFSRSTAAPTVNPMNRTINVLPNTPRFNWIMLNGKRVPVLRLDPARTISSVTYAVDKVYWNGTFPTNGLGVYVRFKADFNPATASGYIAHIGETTNASPVARLGVASGQYYFRYHNGTTVLQTDVPVNSVQGQVIELLATFDDTTMGLILAVDGEYVAQTFTGAPSGGYASNWSANKLVLNGYDTFPLANEFLTAKVVKESAFTKNDYRRIYEVRDAVLDPFGVLIE